MELSSLKEFDLNDFIANNNRIQKALVKSTSQEVVFKYVQDNKYDDLREEFENLNRISYPSIQKVFGFYIHKNVISSVLVTPYYPNSLDVFLSQTPELSSCKKIVIIYGICNAMKYLEANRMHHGNLKPSKILLDNLQHPILIGIGKHFTKSQIENENKIINYLAPEVINDQIYSNKADVYSFGLIINQLYTNEIPYSDIESNNGIIQEIKNNHFPRIYNDDNWVFTSIVQSCLDLDPSNRPTFEQLCTEINAKFNTDRYMDIKNSITDYMKKINTQIDCPINFFRIPKVIFDSGDTKEMALYSFNLDNFLQILSKVEPDAEVVFIMVFGVFQAGKSTFLKAITGNGAYTTGKGHTSNTKGVNITKANTF